MSIFDRKEKKQLNSNRAYGAALSVAFAPSALSSPGGALAADADAANALMKKSDCTKCHAADTD